jgi:predicted GNAT family acetyltransferase
MVVMMVATFHLNGLDMHQQTLDYLLTDPLKHLTHLKYLHHYRGILTCYHAKHANGDGVLISYPTQEVFWDHETYASSQYILLITASDQTAAEMLLKHVQENYPADVPLVFKFNNDQPKQVFARAFHLEFQRALISFTSTQGAQFTPSADVVISSVTDLRTVDLYMANGYTHEEIEAYFAEGALSFAFYENGELVCVCMTYRNYDSIWEIAAVNTVARARRKGYARRVVQTALHTLIEEGKIPRYAVLHTNTASIQLAESLGLYPFLRLEHYLRL